jgi:hypothetical protein
MVKKVELADNFPAARDVRNQGVAGITLKKRKLYFSNIEENYTSELFGLYNESIATLF